MPVFSRDAPEGDDRSRSRSGDFEELLLGAINEGMADVLGQNTARSVAFYVDPRIAISDAESYSKSLERVFKEGAGVVLEAITERLCRRTGSKRRDFRTFSDAVVFLRLSFNQAGE